MNERIDTLETPRLLLDSGRLERNLERMRRHLAVWPQVVFRPHMKTAKCVEVARRALPGGGPITVSTLHEAEYFFGHGFDDILYAVGISPDKLARLGRLRSRGAKVSVILDSVAAAGALAAHARKTGDTPPVLIEIDTDGHRSGVKPDDAVLPRIGRILSDAGLLAGVLTHAGESYNARSVDDLHAYADLERSGILRAVDRLRAAGMEAPVVSVGSTPSVLYARDLSGITEVRAGVFMFQDLVMAGAGVCTPDDLALSVLTTVIGHQPEKGWVITDAGWMALSRDRGTERQAVDQGYGLVCDLHGRRLGDLMVISANQEHGVIADRSGGALSPEDFPIGKKLRVLTNHACATAAQHAGYTILDADAVVDRWDRERGW